MPEGSAWPIYCQDPSDPSDIMKWAHVSGLESEARNSGCIYRDQTKNNYVLGGPDQHQEKSKTGKDVLSKDAASVPEFIQEDTVTN